MNQFNPDMLTLAREACELTQSDLAARIGVSQSKLSKFEHGLLAPSDREIATLAEHLTYPAEFFLQQGYRYSPPIRFHRKKASVAKRVMDRIHALTNIRALQVQELWRSVEYTPDHGIPHLDPDEFDGAIEDIARAVRSSWRMHRGPVENMTALLERAGVMVIPMDFTGADVDAIAQIIPGMQPLIFVNQDAPADRLRFTLAHELGHLVMHDIPTPDMEKEANRFAAEFLMPAEDIAPQLSRVTLTLLASLKRVWKVSMAALLETAKRLDRITQRQYIRLRTELSRFGYLKREPAHLDVPREQPEMLRDLVAYHVQELNYSLEDLSRALKDTPARVRDVFLPGPRPALRMLA